MTDERIESVLADFRGWLKALPQEPPAAVPVEAFNVGAPYFYSCYDREDEK